MRRQVEYMGVVEDKAVALNKAISSGKSFDNKWANWIMEGGGVRTSKGFPWLVMMRWLLCMWRRKGSAQSRDWLRVSVVAAKMDLDGKSVLHGFNNGIQSLDTCL